MKKLIFIIICSSFNLTYAFSQPWQKVGSGLYAGGVYDLFNDTILNKLIIGGTIYKSGDLLDTLNGIGQWDGLTIKPVGTGFHGNPFVYSIGRISNKLVASGWLYPNYYGNFFAYFDSMDNQWDTMPNGPNANVRQIINVNDTLYLGGFFTKFGQQNTFLSGSFDGVNFIPQVNLLDSYSVSSSNVVYSISYFQNKLIVGGSFHSIDGVTNLAIVSNGTIVQLNQCTNPIEYISSLDVFQNELIIAGRFIKSNGNAGNNIVAFDGAIFRELISDNPFFNIRAIKSYNNLLFIGGVTIDANGFYSNDVIMWNGVNWISLGNNQIDEDIFTIEVYNDSLFIGGAFNCIGTECGFNKIAKYNIPVSVLNINDQNNPNLRSLNLYPNPVNNLLNIQQISSHNEQAIITIFDSNGNLVFNSQIQLQTGINNFRLNINSFSIGIYFLRIYSNQSNKSTKFIKQ